MPRVAAFVLALVLVAPSVRAQIFTGQVVDSVAGHPVGRGFIVLMDASGRELVRDLTTADGRFRLRAPAPGTYRVRSERIGYAAWESPLTAVGRAETQVFTARVMAIPRRLAAITVTERTECQQRRGPDLELLWNEASKALRAASWSAERDLYVHRTHHYERQLDVSRNERESETVTIETLSTTTPFTALDPEVLSERGFVVDQPDGSTWFYGVDAEVLLHPSFHGTHCFWAIRGGDEREGQIGLAFEPVPDRDVTDVSGVLWLDESSAELRQVEFRYENLPARSNSEHVGGWATFVPMPSGAWIVEGWRLQLPIVRGAFRRRPRIVGYRDTGAGVLESFTADGARVYESPRLATLRGVVYDAETDAPAAGATVIIVGTDYTATTGDDGAFEMRTLLEGPYEISTRRLEWLGYTPGRLPHAFVPGSEAMIRMTHPRIETVHREACRGAPVGSNRLIHGQVRTTTDRPLGDVDVVARWAPGIERKARTDDDGRYVLCDLPPTTTITILARHRRYAATPVEVRFIERDAVITAAGTTTSVYVPDRVVRVALVMTPR